MRFDEYVANTRRTWNKKESLQENLNHAFLGLVDESGELAKEYKSELAYGKPLDKTNVAGEIGDLMYFSARVIDELKFGDSDKLYKKFNQTIKEPLKEKVEASEVDIVLAIASRACAMHMAVATQDGAVIVRSMTDLYFAIKSLTEKLNVSLESIMEANIKKLKKRFPEKFKIEEALNRDVDSEQKAIEDNVRKS